MKNTSDQVWTIDGDNVIMVYATAEIAARNEDSEKFSSEAELQALIEKWPANRTLEIYNGMPVKSVTEFASPEAAAAAIWKVVGKMQAPRAPGSKPTPKEPVMSKKSSSKKEPKSTPAPKSAPEPKKTKAERKAEKAALKASKKEARAKAKAARKAAKPAKEKKAKTPKEPKAPRAPKAPKTPRTPKEKATGPREGSKGAEVLDMMTKAKGATIGEIMKATKWLPHTTRGFLSTLGKKYPAITIESTKDKDGERTYKATVKK